MNNRKEKLLNYFLFVISILFLCVILYPFYIQKISFEEYLENYSSLILIYLTYIYVLLTYRILNSSSKLSKEQLRPYVIANFVEENNSVFLSIKNYGKRPAYNVKINMTDGFENLQIDSIKGNYKYLLEQKFLAPSQEIKNLVTDPAYIISPRKKDINKCFDFDVVFSDSDQKKYELKYQIDFNNLFYETSIKKDSIIDSLKDIQKEVKNLNDNIKDFIKKNV